MFRAGFAVLLGGAALSTLSVAVQAADYPDTLRGSYDWVAPTQCEPQCDDTVGFEFGLRYVYSRGQHHMALATGDTYDSKDTSHILEGHLRIDDTSTTSFVKANIGYSMSVESTYSTPATGNADVTATDGTVAYGGVDFGYTPYQGFGGLVGYAYMNESPHMGRVSYTTASGGDSEVNDLAIHALKLGVTGRTEYGAFSIDGEAALIPWASLSGTYGGFSTGVVNSGGVNYQQGSAGQIDASLYGASAEVNLGYKATDNVKLNLGGRVSYLTGSGDMTYTGREVGNPGNAQSFITRTTDLSFLRYGVFGGISATF